VRPGRGAEVPVPLTRRFIDIVDEKRPRFAKLPGGDGRLLEEGNESRIEMERGEPACCNCRHALAENGMTRCERPSLE
jgi:hypothetical protein